ncbi:MAG: hypothetical protein U0805_10940 [Pirellulales bacterium]
MTYTLNTLPPAVEAIIRARAASEQISPEQAIIEVLMDHLGANAQSNAGSVHPTSVGSWKDNPEFEVALREQRLIDWEVWSDGVKRRDLSGIAGLNLITPEMKAVFAEQRRVDPELWK